MTAVVKHISVHPNYRRCRVVGIFDDLDQKHSGPKANLDRHRQNKQAGMREMRNNQRNSFAYYIPTFVKVMPDKFPEGHRLTVADILNLPDPE